MRRALVTLALATAALAAAVPSLAQVDVELAFSPDTAGPGTAVTLLASIANLGAEPVEADLAVTISVGPFTIGPIRGRMALAAGQELSREVRFVVPRLPLGGTITLTVTATAGGSSDTATASLTIVPGAAAAADETALRSLGRDVLLGLGATPTVRIEDDASMSEVKRLYR